MPERSTRAADRNVLPIIIGQAVSLLGDYIAIIALPLFVLDLTGSARDLGVAAAFETLPTALFGFAVGVVLDRVSLKRALIIADVGRAAAFGVLAIAAASGASQVWMVFVVAFLVGSLSVGFDSGLQAWLPSLLPDDRLVGINTRLQQVRTGAWAIGPPLAGFLAESRGGFGVAFGIDGLTFLVSAAAVVMLVEIKPRQMVEHEPWWPSFLTGIRYLVREPRLRVATFGATIANMLFIPIEALLALFASERLGIPEGALFGWFVAGHALIGLVGLAAAPALARGIGLGRTFVLGLTLQGAGFLVLAFTADAISAFSPVVSTITAAIPAGVSVAGVSLVNMAFSTLRQQIPPEELLGRVIAASRTLAWSGIPVAAAVAGLIAERHGVQLVYVGSTSALLVVALLLLATPLFRTGNGGV